MKKPFLSIAEAADFLGVSKQTLRRWHNSGFFRASLLSPGKHRLYRLADLELHAKGLAQLAKEWVMADVPNPLPSEFYCQTSDVFKARLERMVIEMENTPTQVEVGPFVTSVTGEVGNNSFDHNLGNWPDTPGVFFGYNLGKRIVVVADRGRGILRTLRVVRKTLSTESEALTVAFSEVLTGRAPEKRGNGLKYVRKAVAVSSLRVQFQSYDAVVNLEAEHASPVPEISPSPIRGCLFILHY